MSDDRDRADRKLSESRDQHVIDVPFERQAAYPAHSGVETPCYARSVGRWSQSAGLPGA